MPQRHFLRFFLTALATGVLWLALTSSAAAQGPQVGGRIVDPQGRPIAGAELTLHRLPSAWSMDLALLEGTEVEGVSSARSNGQGHFEIEAPETGMWLLTVTARGRIEVGVFLLPLLHSEELEPIVLKATRDVWVEVVDGDGHPVHHARVVLDARPGRQATYPLGIRRAHAWTRRQMGHTDETGRLHLLAPESGKYMLQVMAEGFGPWSEDHRSNASEQVVLQRGTSRTLLVRGPDGRPLEKALLRRSSEEMPLTLTDEQGLATLHVSQDEGLLLEVLSPQGGRAKVALQAEGSEEPLQVLIEPSVPLTGLVIAKRNRTPVEGAIVWSSSDPTSFTRSDHRGYYRLALTSQARGAGGNSLSAAARGYFRTSSDLSMARWDLGRGPRLVLDPAATVRGTVMDSAGRTLVGVAIRELASGAPTTSTISGEDGGFVLSPLALGHDLRLEATLPGYSPTVVEVPRTRGRQPVDVSIRMLDGRIAYGTVVDEDEEPITTAVITLNPTSVGILPEGHRSASLYAESGELGRFELQDITAGTFDLRAEAPGFAPVTVPGIEITRVGRQVDLGTLILGESALIEGRVVDVWGDPLADAEVRIRREPDSITTRSKFSSDARVDAVDATSDARGRFVMENLAPGQTVELEVTLEGYAAASLPSVQAPTRRPLKITLEEATVLRGRVVDEGDEPVSAAYLRLDAQPGSGDDPPHRTFVSPVRFGSSDTTGSFEIHGVMAGRWDLSVQADGFLANGIEAIEVVRGEEPEEVFIVLRRGAIVRGRVTSRGGEPLSSARVSAFANGRAPLSTTTGSDGTYSLNGLPTRHFSFAVEHPEHPKKAHDLEVEPGENRLDFELEESWKISGQVTDTDHRPIAGAQVQALPAGGGRVAGHEAQATASTDGGGRFTVAVQAQGNYILRTEKSGYADAQTKEPVLVEGPSVDGIDLRLERGGIIAGRVKGLQFDELPEVQILALRADRSEPPTAGQVDYAGLYRLENLPEGEWTVLAMVGQTGKIVRETTILQPGSDEVSLDLEFGGGLTLSGQVVRSSQPVPGAQVQATATETFSGSLATTDQGGRFRLEGLDLGTYEVVVSGVGSGSGQQETVLLDSDREILIELVDTTLRGQVLDDLTGTPIQGARVAVTATEQGHASPSAIPRTDTGGVFRVGGIAPGLYHLRVSREGYGNGSVEVEVSDSGEFSPIEVRLRPSEGLTLQVLHPTGSPAAAVSLMALDSTGQPLLAGRYDADESGHIRLAELPAGAWTLLTASHGTATATQGVEAPGGPVTIWLPETGGLAVRVPALLGSGRRAQLTLRDQQGQAYRDVLQSKDRWELIDGVTTVPLMPAGAWTLEVRTADQQEAWTTAGQVVPGRVVDVFVE